MARGDERLLLRHKLLVRVGAVAVAAATPWWLAGPPWLQACFTIAILVAVAAPSLRAVVMVDGDVVYQRTLRTWDAEPVLLVDLAYLSVQRELGVFLHFTPLLLRLWDSTRSPVELECWAWNGAGWRALAHRAGHFARELGVEFDDDTARRVRCTDIACPDAFLAYNSVNSAVRQAAPTTSGPPDGVTRPP
jgi:hypothetical protein